MNGFVKIHDPANVPAASMAPGTKERELLKAELERQKKNPIVIPAIIGGKEVYTDDRHDVIAPHDHSLKLGEFCRLDAQGLKDAVNAAMDAKERWEALPVEHRLAIFEKAADLIEKCAGSFLFCPL